MKASSLYNNTNDLCIQFVEILFSLYASNFMQMPQKMHASHYFLISFAKTHTLPAYQHNEWVVVFLILFTMRRKLLFSYKLFIGNVKKYGYLTANNIRPLDFHDNANANQIE